MRAIVRKRKQRSALGKASLIRVRGKIIAYEEEIRYCKRKRISIEDFIAQRKTSATPETVECFTPISSRVATPEIFAIPEQTLISIRDYHQGSFESGSWVSEDQQSRCRNVKAQDLGDHVETLFFSCMLACVLFEKHQFEEAGRILIYAFANIQNILLAELPRTLRTLLLLIILIHNRGKHEIAIALLRQFSSLGELVLGKGHPLPRIFGNLASLISSEPEESLRVCLHSIGDNFEKSLGPMHIDTLSSRILEMEIGLRGRNVGRGRLALRELLADCDQKLGLFDVRTLYIRQWLACSSGDLTTAKKVSEDILAYSHPRHLATTHFRIEGLTMVAKSEHGPGQMLLAEKALRRVIDSRISTWGKKGTQVSIWLLLLESWLLEEGDYSSAAQLQSEKRHSLIPSLDTMRW